ncbi:hypothetical protein LTS08_000234 [Lithohypha guttulata]|uniref:uncharacterized protein n=1 Tax=Lithohypha guttulata TaxID=1690604 RepID=UPI002DDFEFA9|nr:hypothetical protein LTR51_007143 [Lithohypha guttulata]KAK5106117.1 hypothetical protein LTS08_000234 [Lithohypha guttulata]
MAAGQPISNDTVTLKELDLRCTTFDCPPLSFDLEELISENTPSTPPLTATQQFFDFDNFLNLEAKDRPTVGGKSYWPGQNDLPSPIDLEASSIEEGQFVSLEEDDSIIESEYTPEDEVDESGSDTGSIDLLQNTSTDHHISKGGKRLSSFTSEEEEEEEVNESEAEPDMMIEEEAEDKNSYHVPIGGKHPSDNQDQYSTEYSKDYVTAFKATKTISKAGKPLGIHKKPIPANISKWIRNNVSLVLSYLQALDDGKEADFDGEKYKVDVKITKTQFSPLTEFDPETLQPTQSNTLNVIKDSSLSRTTWSGRTATKGLLSSSSPSNKENHPNPHLPTNPDELQDFVEPDFDLAYSIDHTTTNPDTKHRLAVPYPAPQSLLNASKRKYADNVRESHRLAAQGVPEKQRRIPWTIFEDDQVIKHMLEIKDDPTVPKTEARFEEVARRMENDGLEPRSKTAVKNMWCRVGRGRSGYDERKGVRRDARFAVNHWKAAADSPRKRTGKVKGGKKVVKVVDSDEE